MYDTKLLETLRTWVNEGFRRVTSDPIIRGHDIIRLPTDPVPPHRIRQDLRSLSSQELTLYRDRVASLGVDDLKGKWQELGLLRMCRFMTSSGWLLTEVGV